MTKQHGVLEYLNAFLRQIKIRFIRINSAKKDEKNTNSRDIVLMVFNEQESGKKVSELCRDYLISQPTFDNWKSIS